MNESNAKTRPPAQKQPNEIDIYVGSRIRQRRKAKNMTQQQLSGHLGITFQQIQKYEKGINRVGASRLHAISEVLEVPVSFFYSDSEAAESASALNEGFDEDSAVFSENCSGAEGMQLIRAFVRIGDPKLRRRIIDLTVALAESRDL